MNDTTIVMLILAALVALLVVGVLGYRRFMRWLRFSIATEREKGNLRHRRRITNAVGRFEDAYEAVLKAETMPGYVWFRWTRHPRQPFVELTGWVPFKWVGTLLLRHLARRRERTPRR